MKQEINSLILAGRFKEAYNQIQSFDNEKIYTLLMDLAWDSKSITIYGFINYLILLGENHFLHLIASVILSNPLCHIEGAYPTALFHARRALDLDPDNFEYLQYLLFFHNIPDEPLQKDEAIEIAKAVLKRDPEHKKAKEALERYKLSD